MHIEGKDWLDFINFWLHYILLPKKRCYLTSIKIPHRLTWYIRYKVNPKLKNPYIMYTAARGSIYPILYIFDVRAHYYQVKIPYEFHLEISQIDGYFRYKVSRRHWWVYFGYLAAWKVIIRRRQFLIMRWHTSKTLFVQSFSRIVY